MMARITALADGSSIIMAFQAYIDDSYSDNVYVLAGHIAPAEEWAQLSYQWNALLPKFGTLNLKTENYHFKMSEMATTSERMERVAAFYRLIEKFVSFSFSVWLRPTDIELAIQRVDAEIGQKIN